ncbi:hypothetical protein I546_5790 [Mycobacterium kansasii 732]|nr:hypothetical protein I546_5790 [Mycobacterium kansasii 732]
MSTRGDGRHWGLTVSHAELGEPRIAASVEFARPIGSTAGAAPFRAVADP